MLEDLYVQDLDKDTLLFSPSFTVDINTFSLKQRKIDISNLALDGGQFYLKTYKNRKTNLQFIIDYFAGTKPRTPKKPRKKPFEVMLRKVALNNIAFRYHNFNRNNKLKRINFDDINLYNFSTTLLNLDTKNHLLKAQVNNLTFREKSGFYLKNLTTEASIDTNNMEFKKLFLQTENSQVGDYLLLKYSKFSDFNNFVNKVYVFAGLKKSTLHARDISFFTDATKSMNLNVNLNGNISGYVNNIKAKQFSVRAGQASYLKGDFSVKGLPSINKTVLDLRFSQLHSNPKDVEYIAKAVTGKPFKLPAIGHKFGNVSFAGTFSGLAKDFNAKGEFKTALGRIAPNIHMNLTGTPRYSGTVKASDFDLRTLLNRKDLGRASVTANVRGQGFSLKGLQENVRAEIGYFDFRGYRYTNINVNGSFNKNLFDGRITVNDRNVKLNFSGGINLNPQLPQFNFTASIRSTNLHKLGFIKDTLQVDADFSTNFTGNNLSNIQGNLELMHIRMTSASTSMVVDSVNLFARGTGDNRSLTINSDILDASIHGQYDLNTLPSYFKSVVKKYIPSVKMDVHNPGNQNFDFSLKLKYFEPVSVLFVPDLQIPEGAFFNGKFNSSQNTAILTGSSPLVQYKNIKVNNVIIDETTSADALNLFLTADRIDLNERLYIQNINFANILKNDSLSLNVKLSDKDAMNQLDLNGLLEFGQDTLVKFSLLPSDVVINQEVWRIQEKVSLNFDQNKVIIEGFELFRDDQLLTIDGTISPDPKDVLNVEFKKFKLATFNPLAQGAAITLSGELNGSLAVSSATKTPKVESDIHIDSLTMNNTPIGDVTLTANLDNESKLIDVEMNVMRGLKETLFASGTYNAAASENKLDLDLVMDHSQLVIFQPFIKHLVSDVSGAISAQLKVTGSALDPKINGSATLHDAALTVNYLKTHYVISDKVGIDNSIIKLNSLELRDIKGNKAIATGSVDMRNPKIPDIDVTLKTTKFMALNTTARDNPLYYGTAYGTGTFSFKGPTNHMRIDIDAKTDAGTIFNIPLNAAETVGNTDFITFVAKDSTLSAKKTQFFTGLVMTFNLEVDEATQVNIITDIGRLNGKGKANPLRLNITSAGDFEMYGDYLISGGKFEFTAQDYINKIFEIRRGGSIRWTGDPTQALINLRAIYEVRTNLRPLYIAAGRPPTEQSVQTEAVIDLSGELTQPGISFDINFPNDSYVKDEFQSYFSDGSNKSTQALSLIARRSFAPNTGLVNQEAVLNTAFSAGTELVFNQLNNVLAQSLNLKSVDISVRSLNEASASVRLLKDRLILNGGVTDRRAEVNDLDVIGSAVARDVEALYLLKKDASVILRASNRLNNRNFLNPNQEYVSALGLVYRRDFDNLNEFLKALIGKNRKDERKEPQPLAPPVTPPSTTAPVTPSGSRNDEKRTPNR